MNSKNFFKSLFLIIQILSLVALVLAFSYYGYYFLWSFTKGWDIVKSDEKLIPFSLLYLLIPFLLICLTIYLMIKSIKSKGVFPDLFKKNKQLNKWFFVFYSLYYILLIFIIGVFAAIVIAVFTDKPPRFFPIDDVEATYKITIQDLEQGEKNQPAYYIVYDTTSNKNDWKICDEVNGKKRCYTEKHQHMEVIIGQSPVDLKSYIGKKIKVQGDFVYSTKQCIKENCIIFPYSLVVFNIKKISNK